MSRFEARILKLESTRPGSPYEALTDSELAWMVHDTHQTLVAAFQAEGQVVPEWLIHDVEFWAKEKRTPPSPRKAAAIARYEGPEDYSHKTDAELMEELRKVTIETRDMIAGSWRF